MPSGFHLAQVNLSKLRFDIDAPEMAGFTAAVDEINRLAEKAPGFVWRYPSEEGHLSAEPWTGDPLTILNLSVWDSYPALHEYAYRSPHGSFVRRRAEWFVKPELPSTVLWWIPAGHFPTPEEAVARLNRLRRYGPTPQAFTVRVRFRPDGNRDKPNSPPRAV